MSQKQAEEQTVLDGCFFYQYINYARAEIPLDSKSFLVQ